MELTLDLRLGPDPNYILISTAFTLVAGVSFIPFGFGNEHTKFA